MKRINVVILFIGYTKYLINPIRISAYTNIPREARTNNIKVKNVYWLFWTASKGHSTADCFDGEGYDVPFTSIESAWEQAIADTVEEACQDYGHKVIETGTTITYIPEYDWYEYQAAIEEFQTELEEFQTELEEFQTGLEELQTKLEESQTGSEDCKDRLRELLNESEDYQIKLQEYMPGLEAYVAGLEEDSEYEEYHEPPKLPKCLNYCILPEIPDVLDVPEIPEFPDFPEWPKYPEYHYLQIVLLDENDEEIPRW